MGPQQSSTTPGTKKEWKEASTQKGPAHRDRVMFLQPIVSRSFYMRSSALAVLIASLILPYSQHSRTATHKDDMLSFDAKRHG
jgi:hypothetical protein